MDVPFQWPICNCRMACFSAWTCAESQVGGWLPSTWQRTLLDMSVVGAADPEQFWEPVLREEGDRIVLTPKDFYLLMSHEAVTISPVSQRR